MKADSIAGQSSIRIEQIPSRSSSPFCSPSTHRARDRTIL